MALIHVLQTVRFCLQMNDSIYIQRVYCNHIASRYCNWMCAQHAAIGLNTIKQKQKTMPACLNQWECETNALISALCVSVQFDFSTWVFFHFLCAFSPSPPSPTPISAKYMCSCQYDPSIQLVQKRLQAPLIQHCWVCDFCCLENHRLIYFWMENHGVNMMQIVWNKIYRIEESRKSKSRLWKGQSSCHKSTTNNCNCHDDYTFLWREIGMKRWFNQLPLAEFFAFFLLVPKFLLTLQTYSKHAAVIAINRQLIVTHMHEHLQTALIYSGETTKCYIHRHTHT